MPYPCSCQGCQGLRKVAQGCLYTVTHCIIIACTAQCVVLATTRSSEGFAIAVIALRLLTDHHALYARLVRTPCAFTPCTTWLVRVPVCGSARGVGWYVLHERRPDPPFGDTPFPDPGKYPRSSSNPCGGVFCLCVCVCVCVWWRGVGERGTQDCFNDTFGAPILQAIKKLISENSQALVDAVYKDVRRHPSFT